MIRRRHGSRRVGNSIYYPITKKRNYPEKKPEDLPETGPGRKPISRSDRRGTACSADARTKGNVSRHSPPDPEASNGRHPLAASQRRPEKK